MTRFSPKLKALLTLALAAAPAACRDDGGNDEGSDPEASSGDSTEQTSGAPDESPSGDDGDAPSTSGADTDDGDGDGDDTGNDADDDNGDDSSGTDDEEVAGAPELGDLVITELLIDAPGDDDGREWVELRNISRRAVSLEGLLLINDDGEASPPLSEDAVLQPGQHAVLAQSTPPDVAADALVFLYGGSPTFSNDGGELSLVLDDVVLDRVAWNRTEGWPVTSGEPMSLAPAFESTAQNDFPGSWCSQPTPSAGAENDACTDFSATEPAAGNIVITEFMTRPDEGADWLEVHNPGDHPLRLHGLEIIVDGDSAEIANGGLELPPNGYLVLTEDASLFGPATPTYEIDELSLGGSSSIVIRSAGVIVDQLTYDNDTWIAEDGRTLVLDPSRNTTAGNDDVLNWCSSETSGSDDGTPGAANAPCPYNDEVPYPAAGDLQITEAMVNAPQSDEGQEWIEVYNDSGHPLRLDHLVVSDSRNDTGMVGFVSEAVGAGEFAVLAQEGSIAADLPVGTVVGAYGDDVRLQNNNDGVELSYDGETIASLTYDHNEDWPLEAGASMTLTASEVGGLNDALPVSWCSSSTATQIFGEDVFASPGASGETCPLDLAPPPTSGDLVITEFMAKVEGEDDGAEWIEIHNRNASPLRLNGLELVVGTSVYEIDATGLEIGGGEYAVLAQSEDFDATYGAAAAHYYGDAFSLGNEFDSITIRYDAEDLDTVAYDELDPLWLVTADYSTSLHPASEDPETNDDPREWCLGWTTNADASRRGTPGAANDACPLRAGEPWPFLEDMSAYDLDRTAPIVLNVEIDPAQLAELQAIETTEEKEAATPAPVQFHAADYPAGDASNATMTVRGASSVGAPQKSWKIKLDGDAYRGQTTLHLSKHTYDITRMRNALGARMLRLVPFLPSFRTQFVHLYVNGEDMGLFTQNEQIDERYLRHRHFDERGSLFKVQGFYFREATAAQIASGEIDGLESKAIDDFSGVFAMLEGLHDDSLSWEEVVEQHFDRDNLIDFLASYYLIRNLDSVSQNYYIYAPVNDPERFYLLPWDLDGGWDFYGQDPQPIPEWRSGFSNWWSNRLFRRMFRDPAFVAEVAARVHELAVTTMPEADVQAVVDEFEVFVRPFSNSSPDADPGHQPSAHAWRDDEVARIAATPQNQSAALDDHLQRPMPVYQNVYTLADGEFEIHFVGAYDIQGDATTTTLAFAPAGCAFRDYACFNDNIMLELTGLHDDEVTLDRATDLADLPAGDYAVLAFTVDEHGNQQASYAEDHPPVITLE